MLMKRARAYSSSGLPIILVYLHPFRRSSLFLQPKIAKNHKKHLLLEFNVINVDNNSKKLVASACYVRQHVCASLQPF